MRSSKVSSPWVFPRGVAALAVGGAAWLATLAAVATPVAAQSGLLDRTALHRHGLMREWTAQIEVDRHRGKAAHLTQHVSATRAITVYEVVVGDERLRFFETELNAFLEPIGKLEAKKKADAVVAQLRREGKQPELITRASPEISLYVTTSRGTLQAIDGQTGATKWTVGVGNPRYPTEIAGANDRYVAAVNGLHLSLFRAEDGGQIWRRTIGGVPGAGPAVGDYFVFVPTTSGAIEAFQVDEPDRPPHLFRSAGRVLVQPAVSAQSVAWPTDHGHLYVGPIEEKGVRFRLETNQPIVAPPAFMSGGQLTTASLDGYVYAINEIRGNIVWKFSAGEPISQTPAPIGDAVYAVTDRGGFYQLDAASGKLRWWTPGVLRFLSASKDRVYCLSVRNELLVLDVKTGARRGVLSGAPADLMLANYVTDRIYLGSASGTLQCLRQDSPEYVLPHHHVGIGSEAAQRRAVQQVEVDQGPAPAGPMPPAADPFGGANDPFGGANDPFRGAPQPAPQAPPAADPFGGAADPFGGGADPFGGN